MTRSRLAAFVVPLTLAGFLLTAGGTTAQSRQPSQSPVDISPGAIRFDPTLPRLEVSYGHSDLDLEYIRKDTADSNGCGTRNHEETEEAVVRPGTGHVTLAGVRYELEQFHFHTPSEHRFAGRADPLEMHFVHRSAAGKLLVIGVPLRAGAASPVDRVLAELAPECGGTVALADFDLNTLLPRDRGTLRYNGSLTTAPFTEGVQWFLMAERTVSPATIARFQGLFGDGNARSPQPLNGRRITAVPQI
ncbi:carbonic anhydrase family protein [Amycolatopsis orientalis]|uniref:carbonic anhydrase family protein n=1 Tax=Amycolatopsis orientalis TaxID=31958 RepID=UPI00041C4329|nr:carbonic anhydrase family protein [Amycolatopsis orientalis]